MRKISNGVFEVECQGATWVYRDKVCNYAISDKSGAHLPGKAGSAATLPCVFGEKMLFHSIVRAPIMEKHDIANAAVNALVKGRSK